LVVAGLLGTFVTVGTCNLFIGYGKGT
jgi:hypothetical protein